MFKIYLAVAHEGLEKFLKSNKTLIETKLKDEVNFVGTAVYREAIVQGVKEYHPDVILIREGIQGSLSLTDLVYQIRIISPTTRIIFIAGDRKPGDAFLSTLTQYGVYDLLIGNKVNAKEMVKRIIYPNTFADVMELIPKTSIDERSNKQLYESPDIGLLKPILENQEQDVPIKPLEEITPIQEKEEPLIKEPPVQQNINEPPKVNLDIQKENEIQDKPKVNLDQRKPVYVAPITPIVENIQPQEPIVEQVKPQPIVQPISQPIIQPQPISPVAPLPPIEEPPTKPEINVSMVKEPIIEQPQYIPPQPIVEPQVVQQPPVQQPIQRVVTPVVPIQTQEPIQQPYTQSIGYTDNNMFTPRVNTQEESQKKGFFGGKKNVQKKISQQIVTFVGGKNGCGTSQVAFNTGLLLAEQGLKVLYLDLNETFSSIDAILEFGLEDLGIDTMLKDIENGNYPNVINGISSSTKILQMLDKKDASYKTYSKLPPKYEFSCFSMQTMYQQKEKDYNVNLLKELNMFLLMNLNYDVIILDAPSDFRNELTKISLIYSNRIFFNVTQDYSDLECFMRNMKIAEGNKIGYKDKTNFILNKYIAHTEMDISSLTNYLINYLRFDNFRVMPVPNVAADIINATNSNSIALWKAKDKMFRKSIQDIANIILN